MGSGSVLEVKVPSIGESVTEVTLAQWLKKDGDLIKMDEPICELESDKATVELPAPESGRLKIMALAGAVLKIGAVVASIDSSVSVVSSPKENETAKENVADKLDAKITSLAAEKIIQEKNIDPASVIGSGPGGRVLKQDALLKASQLQDGKQELNDGGKQELQVTATKKMILDVKNERLPNIASLERTQHREKMSSLRKTIAKRLLNAKHQTAMLTTFNEVDMLAVMDLRKKYKESFKDKYNVSLGLMSFFTKAVCFALEKFPIVNAQIDGDEIVYHDYCDIGVAVATPKGLVVPVLRQAQHLSLAEIELEIARLAAKAKDGKLSLNEMQGGTFTITNGGVFGSMLSTPILNIPQSGILGMHNIVERPWVVQGQIVIRPIMYVALSYDHRLVDGKDSVGFLKMVKECLEEPSRMLLEI